MRPDFSTIGGMYFHDLLDQPQAISDTVSGLETSEAVRGLIARIHRGEFRSLILTGMGSSLHGLIPLQLELIQFGLPAILVETSELIHHQTKLLSPDTLVVGVSQSGQSVETIRLLDINQGKSPVLAITNTPESPLARRADASILTRAGKEHTVSCKTYVSTLAALRWLSDMVCNRDLQQSRKELEQAVPLAEDYLSRWETHLGGFVELLNGVRHLFLLGRGDSIAAALTGALIIKESDHFHAEGMSCAAFRHGPFEMIREETFSLIFAGDKKTRDLNFGLLQDIREQKGRAELIGSDASLAACNLPDGPASIQPILEILPIQMVTLALAFLAGREAGQFAFATKVTTKE